MEHKVQLTITRYKEGQEEMPDQVMVYELTRYIEDGDFSKLYEILDDAKGEAFDAIDEDIKQNCEHEDLDDLEDTCFTCGKSGFELLSDLNEGRIDAQIDQR